MRLNRWVANWIHSSCRLQIAQRGVYCGVQLCRSLQPLHANCPARWISKSTPHRAIFESIITFFSQNLDFLAKVVHAISAEELRMTMNIGTFCPQSTEGSGYSTILYQLVWYTVWLYDILFDSGWAQYCPPITWCRSILYHFVAKFPPCWHSKFVLGAEVHQTRYEYWQLHPVCWADCLICLGHLSLS